MLLYLLFSAIALIFKMLGTNINHNDGCIRPMIANVLIITKLLNGRLFQQHIPHNLNLHK